MKIDLNLQQPGWTSQRSEWPKTELLFNNNKIYKQGRTQGRKAEPKEGKKDTKNERKAGHEEGKKDGRGQRKEGHMKEKEGGRQGRVDGYKKGRKKGRSLHLVNRIEN
ncbi:hypothetical protein ILYODFUR_025114 [Ilyodon furcidens]|uniref:Uncharacterized protein n=1 Tax=Ilyodon furcidens TaxID=33524 RepID=A0ABV0TXJ3_9TELE